MALDLLRFFAAMSVTIYHYAAIVWNERQLVAPLGNAFRFGYLGVELFFMISGFVIALSIQGRRARAFIVHRVVRLYPTFLLALALAIITATTVGQKSFTGTQIAANATMFAGYLGEEYIDRVYWTLGVEWKFYFIMACLAALGLHRRLDRIGVLWSLVLLAIHAGLNVPGLRSAAMFPYGAHFAFGILVMDVHKNGLSALRSFGLLVALGGILQTANLTLPGFISSPTRSDALLVTSLALLLALSFAGLLLSVRPDHFRSPSFRRLGSMTYPLYLLHAGVGSILIEHWRPTSSYPANVFLAVAVTLALVLAVTLVLEERIVPTLARSSMVRRVAGEA